MRSGELAYVFLWCVFFIKVVLEGHAGVKKKLLQSLQAKLCSHFRREKQMILALSAKVSLLKKGGGARMAVFVGRGPILGHGMTYNNLAKVLVGNKEELAKQ